MSSSNMGDESKIENDDIEHSGPTGELSRKGLEAASAEAARLELENALAEKTEEARVNHDKYLRALADLENFKKQKAKERADLLRYQGDRIVADLVEVLDNLELAVKHSATEPEKLRAGVELILRQFIEVLGRWEIKGESSVGQQFDPTKHQALSKMPAADSAPGTILNEFKKAYFYKDKLLRVGQVIVADGSEGNVAEANAGVKERDDDASDE